MNIHELETPALLIDLEIMERNIRRVAEYARSHNLRLRPHTKTHKTPALGRMQLDSGAAGLTVAKVGEAEVMAASGTPDLLVAYPVVGRSKLDRLMEVARQTRVTVALDSIEAAQGLSEAAARAGVEVGVLAEIDAGLDRVGVAPGPDVVRLAESLQRLPHLSFDGITFYPGHIRTVSAEGLEQLERLSTLLDRVIEDLGRAGISPRTVSGGSTPALFHSHHVRHLNEIRPGTYIFNDRNTVCAGACTLGDCAASILVTVVSAARPGRAMVDGGSKTFSSDALSNQPDGGFGYIAEAPEVRFFRMQEEHGYLDTTRSERGLSVGDRLRIIPNHICAAVNLHERIYGIRGERVETVWRVEARGKLQ